MVTIEEYRKILDKFKSAKISFNDSVILIENLPAVKVLGMWGKIKPIFNLPETNPPANECAQWLWLWEKIDYSCGLFEDCLGYPESKLKRIIKSLIIARLVYPDGTISEAGNTEVLRTLNMVVTGKKKEWEIIKDEGELEDE